MAVSVFFCTFASSKTVNHESIITFGIGAGHDDA